MSISVPTTVTGSAITGLTTPGFTVAPDQASDGNTKAYVVTALTGTQTGAAPHKNEMPFRILFRRPKKVKIPGARNGVTGQYVATGKNEYEMLVVKGMNSLNGLSGYQYQNILMRLTVSVPAALAADVVQLQSAFSFLGGVLTSQLQGLCDTTQNSVM